MEARGRAVSRPAATVVIPFLDPPVPFFREAIDSVLTQTRGDWELVLVDDGSGEEARRVAREAEAGDSRIRVVDSPAPRPAGISAARNAGIAVARGEFLAMLDADDLYEPDRLERHVEALRRAPEAAMAIGDTTYWSTWQAGGGRRDVVPEIAVVPGIVAPPRLLLSVLEGRGAVPCVCSFTVRREVIGTTGAFEPEFRATYEDQVFLSRIAASRPVLYVQEALDRYRIHEASLTAGASRPGGASERRRFIDWLEIHAVRQAPPASRARLERALRRARWELDHPALAGLRRRFRKWRDRWGRFR